MAARKLSPFKFNKQEGQRPINLLPKEGFATSTPGRVLAWSITTFRVIVIVVEIVVMAAFLSRFWLDARAQDLNETLLQKSGIILASQDFEDTLRVTAKSLSVFDALSQREPKETLLNKIVGQMPADIYLASFSYSKGAVALKGVSAREVSIAQFIVNLKSVNEFDVTLSDLSLNEDGRFAFGIGVTFTEN